MILVSVGTSEMPFKRLIEAVNKSSFSKDILLQYGSNHIKDFEGKAFQFIERKKMLDFIKKSDLIISHAGIGSILDSIYLKKKLIIVERKIELGESKANQDPAINYFKTFPNIEVCIDLNNLDECINLQLSKQTIFEKKTSPNDKKISNIINKFFQNSYKHLK